MVKCESCQREFEKRNNKHKYCEDHNHRKKRAFKRLTESCCKCKKRTKGVRVNNMLFPDYKLCRNCRKKNRLSYSEIMNGVIRVGTELVFNE